MPYKRLVRFPSHDGFRRFSKKTGAQLPGRWHATKANPLFGIPKGYKRGWTAKRAVGKAFLAQKRWRAKVGSQKRAQLGRLKRRFAARKIYKAFKNYRR